MTMSDLIKRKLTNALAPDSIAVVDESEAHRGHSGYREGGETHFVVEIVSPAFEGLSRIARQRSIHAALADELRDRIHALSIKAETPTERAKRETG